MLPRRIMALLLAAPLLLATACGDAVRQQPNPKRATAVSLAPVVATINPSPTPSSSAAPTKAASSAAPASSGGASSAPAPGAANEVKTVVEIKFVPDNLAVKTGTEVTFVNAGGGAHTVTGGADAPDPASPIGNNPLSNEGDNIKVKFDKPGTYPFFCIPHQSLGMKGQIVVS